MANVLMVIAPDGFKDEEYYIPKKILEENKHKVYTVSLKKQARSVAGKTQEVDMLLDEVDDINHYSAVVFIGGPGADCYFENKKAREIIKEMDINGKIIAAICIAPATLAFADLLKGKKATCFPSVKDVLIDKGAKYTGEAFERDANILTANGPEVAEEFGKQIADALRIYD